MCEPLHITLLATKLNKLCRDVTSRFVYPELLYTAVLHFCFECILRCDEKQLYTFPTLSPGLVTRGTPLHKAL